MLYILYIFEAERQDRYYIELEESKQDPEMKKADSSKARARQKKTDLKRYRTYKKLKGQHTYLIPNHRLMTSNPRWHNQNRNE